MLSNSLKDDSLAAKELGPRMKSWGIPILLLVNRNEKQRGRIDFLKFWMVKKDSRKMMRHF